ncbi:MAG: hypothetical protein WDM80_08090 [Limisphaerales bacterium]
MTTNNATNEQLELGFNGPPLKIASVKREGRIARTNWWFAKMREAVEGAMDWQTANEPRPQQIWMPGANREVKI